MNEPNKTADKTEDVVAVALHPGVRRRFEVWFEPTPEGERKLGWKPGKAWAAGPGNAEFVNLADAQEAADELRASESHDFGDYARYVVREICQHEWLTLPHGARCRICGLELHDGTDDA